MDVPTFNADYLFLTHPPYDAVTVTAIIHYAVTDTTIKIASESEVCCQSVNHMVINGYCYVLPISHGGFNGHAGRINRM
jgi:hypothetical protein